MHIRLSVFLLLVPNAPRVPVGESVAGCSESRSCVSVVRHVGGLLSADGRHDPPLLPT